jgi:hypothetical protein
LSVAIPAAGHPRIPGELARYFQNNLHSDVDLSKPVTIRGCLTLDSRRDLLVLLTNEQLHQVTGGPSSVSSERFELIGDSDLLYELERRSLEQELDITMWLKWDGSPPPIAEPSAPGVRFPG